MARLTARQAVFTLLLFAAGALAAEPRKSAAVRNSRPASSSTNASDASSERGFWGQQVVFVTNEGDSDTAVCPSRTKCTLRQSIASGAAVVTFGRGVKLIQIEDDERGEIVIDHSVAIIGNPWKRVKVEATASNQNLFIIPESDITVSFTSFDLSGFEGTGALIQIVGDGDPVVANIELTVKDMTFDQASLVVTDFESESTGCTINALKSRFLSGITDKAIVIGGKLETLFVKGCYFGNFGTGSTRNAILVLSYGNSINVAQSLFDGSKIRFTAGTDSTAFAPSTAVIDRVTLRNNLFPIQFFTATVDYTVTVTSSLIEATETSLGAFLFQTGAMDNTVEVILTCYDGVVPNPPNTFAAPDADNTFTSTNSIDTFLGGGDSALCLEAGPSFFYKKKLEKVAAADQIEYGRMAAVGTG